jgi:hypothetical protein
MKSIRSLILSLAFAFVAIADPIGKYTQIVTGTTTASAVFPGSVGRQARVVFLDATSDLSSSTVTFQSPFSSANIILQSALTNFTLQSSVALSTIFTNGAPVIFQHPGAELAYLGTVYSTTGTTNLIVSGTIGTLAVGDQAYAMDTSRTMKVGATNIRVGPGDCLYVSPYNRPLLIQVNGTSACSLNNIIVDYGQ